MKKDESLNKAAEEYALELIECGAIKPHQQTWMEEVYKFVSRQEQKRKCSYTDVNHLNWIYNRLKYHYNENENYDYMVKFQEIIEQLKKE